MTTYLDELKQATAGSHAPSWPKNDREWARSHIGCNVTTCPNGKCRATGECIEIEAQRLRQAREQGNG